MSVNFGEYHKKILLEKDKILIKYQLEEVPLVAFMVTLKMTFILGTNLSIQRVMT